MKKIVSILLALFSFLHITAQESIEQYHKILLYANSSELTMLSEMGVPTDHGKFKKETFLISDFSESQIELIKQTGLEFEVLMKDVASFYQSRLTSDHKPHGAYKFGDPHMKHFRGGAACGGGSGGTPINYATPANFSLGSMGGYFTYQEFLDNLDSMAAKYPNLITVRAPIDSSGVNFVTEDGKNVYWVKISDNPYVDEAEPELMYSAIHHAREPASLSELIFYMWHLLENYGTDAEATYLIDNVEMYFVPMINPDGYIYNEITQPSGGGMWRKNRLDNGGGFFGVDLNRNYSYQYGGAGTSSDPWDDTYKGTGAFSEVETRAMRAFHFDHDFRIALNAHTYGNLLLHPFGYGPVQTSDHNLYQAYTAHMVSQNGFSNILSAQLYSAAGDSDDWGYADDLAQKPKVLSMTPEVGSDSHGFWPATSEIIDICKSTVYMNLVAAHLTHIYGSVQDNNDFVISDQTGYFKYDVQRLGMNPGPLTVSITPLGLGVATIGGSNTHNLAAALDTETDSISYTLDAGLMLGQAFDFELSISNGFFTRTQTVSKIYGNSTVVLADDGSNMNNWTSSSWNTTNEDSYSPNTSITDSPNSDYQNSSTKNITLNSTVDLTNALSATVSFYSKWNIEDNYDYCQLMASTNGTTWTPLCGLYTQNGTNDQDAGEPVWDGIQGTWVKEEVDLVDFIGQTIELRFRMVSDNFVTEDGFYFDDFEINTIDAPVSIQENEIEIGVAMPNPAVNYTYIPHSIQGGSAKLMVFNSFGKLVKELGINTSANQTKLSTQDLAAGVYLYQIVGENLNSASRRLVVIK